MALRVDLRVFLSCRSSSFIGYYFTRPLKKGLTDITVRLSSGTYLVSPRPYFENNFEKTSQAGLT